MVRIKDDKKKILYDYELSNDYIIKLKEYKDIKEGKEKASLISDTMFKTMFCNEKKIKYSAKLLSLIVDVSYEDLLKNMRLAKNELDKDKIYTKGERCDYVAELDETYLNIEMNCNDTTYLMNRNIEYAYKLFSSSNQVGKRYHYKQVIQVNINNFSFKGLEKPIYYMGIENEEFRMINNILIVQIFVPNIYRKCYNEGKESLSQLERYILTMVEYDTIKAKDFALEDEIMKEYVKESEEATFHNGFGEAYDKEWALTDQGKREGLKQGIKQGIEQGSLQKAREIAKYNVPIGVDTLRRR